MAESDYRNMSMAERASYRARLQADIDATGLAQDKSIDPESWLASNLEIPGGIGGAIGGAVAGSAILPGVGTVIGGVLGGAFGSAGGSLLSDVATGQELDTRQAAKEFGTSLLFDAAFMGAGKIARPIWRAGKSMSQSIRGVRPEETIVDISSIDAGTIESLRATDNFLRSRGGGGLSSAQTGQANFITKAAEGIGDLGVFSQSITKARIEKNNQVIQNALDDIAGGQQLDRLENIGDMFAGALETGRTAAKSLYEDGLKALDKEFGKRKVKTTQLAAALRKFEKDNQTALVSKIGDEALEYRSQLYSRLFEEGNGSVLRAKSTDLEGLTVFAKRVNNEISKAMPGAKNADPVLVRDLTQLKKAVDKGISDTLLKISPKAKETFDTMNSSYSKILEGLTPPMTADIVTKAGKESYTSIGRTLVSSRDNSKVKAMLNTIDVAFEAAKKAKTLPARGVESAEQAKTLIRQGYVQEMFGGLPKVNDFDSMFGLTKRLLHPEALSRAQAIMGKEHFNNYKKIVNAIQDTAAKGDDSTLFGLALRGREVSSGIAPFSNIAQGGVGGAALAAGSGLAAAAFFTLPAVLSKLATNRVAVNRLLYLNKNAKWKEMTEEVAVGHIGRVIKSMSEDDQKDFEEKYGLSRDF